MKTNNKDALLKYSKGHFPVVRVKMPTPNKIKRDAEKILQGFDKKNKVSMGQDQNINQHSPDYGYIFVDVSGQNYEVQIRPIPKFADFVLMSNSKKRIKLNG